MNSATDVGIDLEAQAEACFYPSHLYPALSVARANAIARHIRNAHQGPLLVVGSCRPSLLWACGVGAHPHPVSALTGVPFWRDRFGLFDDDDVEYRERADRGLVPGPSTLLPSNVSFWDWGGEGYGSGSMLGGYAGVVVDMEPRIVYEAMGVAAARADIFPRLLLQPAANAAWILFLDDQAAWAPRTVIDVLSAGGRAGTYDEATQGVLVPARRSV